MNRCSKSQVLLKVNLLLLVLLGKLPLLPQMESSFCRVCFCELTTASRVLPRNSEAFSTAQTREPGRVGVYRRFSSYLIGSFLQFRDQQCAMGILNSQWSSKPYSLSKTPDLPYETPASQPTYVVEVEPQFNKRALFRRRRKYISGCSAFAGTISWCPSFVRVLCRRSFR